MSCAIVAVPVSFHIMQLFILYNIMQFSENAHSFTQDSQWLHLEHSQIVYSILYTCVYTIVAQFGGANVKHRDSCVVLYYNISDNHSMSMS